jgi:hypothetical protein
MDLDGVFDDGEAGMLKELEGSTTEDVTMRTRLLENEIRVLRDESNRLALDLQGDREKVKENVEKIKMNKQLPYLVGNVVEILDLKPEVSGDVCREEDGIENGKKTNLPHFSLLLEPPFCDSCFLRIAQWPPARFVRSFREDQRRPIVLECVRKITRAAVGSPSLRRRAGVFSLSLFLFSLARSRCR